MKKVPVLNQQKRNSEKMVRTVVPQIVTHVKAEKKVRRNGLRNVTIMCLDGELSSTADHYMILMEVSGLLYKFTFSAESSRFDEFI